MEGSQHKRLAIDDALMARVAAGEDAARRALYESAHGAIYGFALSITRHPHDAQDVTQDTFLRAFSAAQDYRAMGKPMAWLLVIARNLATQKLRERGRGVSVDWSQHEHLLPDAPRVTAEDRVVLSAALTCLGDEERQIVMLHATSGFKHREIAKMLGLKLSTVLSKYNRAIKKMRDAMKGMDEPC